LLRWRSSLLLRRCALHVAGIVDRGFAVEAAALVPAGAAFGAAGFGAGGVPSTPSFASASSVSPGGISRT